MHFNFFIFAWPGYFEAAEIVEAELRERGENTTVIASGSEGGPERWIKLSDDAYFGSQFVQALRRFEGDVLVHIQADAVIPDFDRFLSRLRSGFDSSNAGVWAPNVDYSFYKTEFVQAPNPSERLASQTLDDSVIRVLNTDCTCWAIHAAVVEELKMFVQGDWNLGWGWDSLASTVSYSMGYAVLRDTSITIGHPRGTGYNSKEAAQEFLRVKDALTPSLQQILVCHEALILERYRHSSQWFRDRLKSCIGI